MPIVKTIQEYGNQLAVIYDDGTRALAYPTVGGLWHVAPITDETPTDPPGGGGGGGLTDWWTPVYGISDGGAAGWEAHASYSRGGTDWPVPFNVGIKAPAAGTVVNYGNVDGAGLKSILVFDGQHQRLIPASNTLMNGVYRETQGGDWAYGFVIQHLNSQVPAGHYNQGEVIGYAGDTGQTTGQHLHAHLVAYPANVGAPRLDFMKFTN